MELPHSLKTLPFVILNKNFWETITVITTEYCIRENLLSNLSEQFAIRKV